jgi:hypothetical protein
MKFIKKIHLTILCLLCFGVANAQYKSYKVATYSYAQFSTSGDSSIDLYDINRKKIGILIFLPLNATQLPDASQDSAGLVRLYYTDSQLQSVVDLLRNESPIILRYWMGSGNNSHIGTASREIIGEGE